jgi:hypothetical protein
MNIVFTYSTGRCGTGYLSHIFGNYEYSKKAFHIQNNNIVSHEPWVDVPVSKIKKLSPDSIEYFLLCKNYLSSKLIDFNDKQIIFITDHKLGRYFLPFLINYNLKFKILKINRDSNDVSKSFNTRLEKRLLEYDSIKYEKYYRDLWNNSLFQPSDIFINNKDEIKWDNLSNLNKFYWYAEEVSAQWISNRSRLLESQYLETNFKDFTTTIEELDKISNFLNLKYNENYILNKTNV